MKKEIHHNLSGSKQEILERVNRQWESFLKNKLIERDLRILIHQQMFETLMGIRITGAEWLDYPPQNQNPEFVIYLEKNKYGLFELAGLWSQESFLTGQPDNFMEPTYNCLLTELLEEFKMDEIITRLGKFQPSQENFLF